MGNAYLQKGAVIQLNNCLHMLKREVSEGVWQLEGTATGLLQQYSTHELMGFYENGELIYFDDRKSHHLQQKGNGGKVIAVRPEPSEELWTAAKTRRLYVKEIEGLPSTQTLIQAAIDKVWNSCHQPKYPPHWITVLRWRKRFLSHGSDAYALVEQNQDKGNRQRRYPNLVIDIVQDKIESIYMTRERNSVVRTWEHAITAVDDENLLRPDGMKLPIPSRRLVKSLIDTIPAFDRYAARYGRTAAIRLYRAKLNHHVTQHRLEVAEIDHTKLDLFVLSDDGKIPYGRPWVTVCIDNHTRCILGLYIGFEPPSYLTVARCLDHAFRPKISLRKKYPSIRHEWEAFGVMRKLVVDNGLEFHGDSLERACHSFNIEIVYTPRKAPWFKGKIERFMRTLNEGVCYGTPGTTFSNIFEKDDYNPAEHALVGISTLKEVIHKWVADYYHQKPHTGLDKISPAVVWASSGSITSTPMPEDPSVIKVLLGKPYTTTLSHKGIGCNKLDYNSSELVDIRRQYGDKLDVDIRIDESNLGHIYVKHPEEAYFIEVPALNASYAEGISLWQHKLFQNYAAKNLGKNDPVTWARAMVEISNIIESSIQNKKRKTNSKVARYHEATKAGKKRSEPSTLDPASVLIPQDLPVASVIYNKSHVRPKFMPVIEPRSK